MQTFGNDFTHEQYEHFATLTDLYMSLDMSDIEFTSSGDWKLPGMKQPVSHLNMSYGMLASSSIFAAAMTSGWATMLTTYFGGNTAPFGLTFEELNNLLGCMVAFNGAISRGGNFTCPYTISADAIPTGYFQCAAPDMQGFAQTISDPCSPKCKGLGKLPSSYPKFDSSEYCNLTLGILLNTYPIFGDTCGREVDFRAVSALQKGDAPPAGAMSGGAVFGIVVLVLFGIGAVGGIIFYRRSSGPQTKQMLKDFYGQQPGQGHVSAQAARPPPKAAAPTKGGVMTEVKVEMSEQI